MASSSLTTNTSAPSLQVDLAGLSQLILNIGSHGLKQLAMAGVDVHSIGCMLMIAEFTPASRDFRKKISNARSAQRSERLWLYKVVEIGAATNFLADQLLKTRAGENVLALMAATIPVMDEDTCTIALTALFEEAKVSLDSTPGLNQLQSIRTDLAPLARKVGFGEKVLNYHSFLCSLVSKDRMAVINDSYISIPLATEIASIIRMLYKIATSQEAYVFICWGLRGAAWITAYATEVLGLPVCTLQEDRVPVPITGSYEDAKVLIELHCPEKKCELYANKTLEEQLQLQDVESGSRRGWNVDCFAFNYLDYRLPKIRASESMGQISSFLAIKTLNRVSFVASEMSSKMPELKESHSQLYGFTSYAESELRHAQLRSLRILRILGFDPGSIEQYEFTASYGCPTYTCVGRRDGSSQSKKDLSHDGKKRPEMESNASRGQEHFHIVDGTIIDAARLRSYLVKSYQGDQRHISGTSNSFQDHFFQLRDILQGCVLNTLDQASYFASHLAFSDWDVSLRRMSVRFLNSNESPSLNPNFGYLKKHMPLVIPVCTDAVNLFDHKVSGNDWIAVDLDGLVVYRNTSRHFAIHDLSGIFFGFTSGRILHEGTECSIIRSDISKITSYSVHTSFEASGALFERQPKPMSHGISVRTLLSCIKSTLYVRLEGSGLMKSVLVWDVSRVSQRLCDTLVSTPCQHGYRGRPRVDQENSDGLSGDDFSGVMPKPIKISEGLTFYESSPETTVELAISYQLVDNHPLGQWLACHWKPNSLSQGFIVIQRDCCWDCLLERIIKLRHTSNRRWLAVCIVPCGNQDLKVSMTS